MQNFLHFKRTFPVSLSKQASFAGLIAAVAASSWSIPLRAQDEPKKPTQSIELPKPMPGDEDYDKAIRLRINLDSMDKLTKIIELAESAIKKGLGPESEESAKRFLAAAYTDKAKFSIQSLLQGGGPRSRKSKIFIDALDDVSKALDLDSSQTDAYLIKAQVLSERQELDEAKEVLTKGIEYFTEKFAERRTVEVRQGLSKLLEARASTEEDPADQLRDFEKACEANPLDEGLTKKYLGLLSQMGQFDKVLTIIDGMLKNSPDSIELIATKISALVRLKEIDKAIEFSTKCIDSATEDETKSSLLRQRAVLYQSLALTKMTEEEISDPNAPKNPEVSAILAKAKSDLDDSLKLVKDNVQAIFLRARLFAQMEDSKSARQDVDAVLDIEEENIEARLFSAELAMVDKDFERAVQDYKTLVPRFAEGTPQREEVLRKLAIAYWQGKQIRLALRTLDQVIRANAGNWEAHRLKGEIYLGQGDHAEAVVAYDKALRLMPDETDVGAQSNLLNNFAWILATSTDDAVRDGERALEMGLKACEMTEFAEAHLVSTLAAAYAENGDFEKAIEYSKKAVELGEMDETTQIDQLREELKNYEAKKPWREKQTDESKPE
jgi:tetratricopeptide (TPR) repeat protein